MTNTCKDELQCRFGKDLQLDGHHHTDDVVFVHFCVVHDL